MERDQEILEYILKLRFVEKKKGTEILRSLKALYGTCSESSASFQKAPGDIKDVRTIRSICKEYEPYADEYRAAYEKNMTSQFFEQHERVGNPRPGGWLSDIQQTICREKLARFIQSRKVRKYHSVSYKVYYEWLLANFPDEMTYIDRAGEMRSLSYATVMKYLKEIYDPDDYIE